MRQLITRRRYLTLSVAVAVAILGWGLLRHYYYPFGSRPAFLALTVSSLQWYAEEHGGRFPGQLGEDVSALGELYPKYLPDPAPLAGISGDINGTRRQLLRGETLTEEVSSWVYVGGFENTNGKLAILWERRAGLGSNGIKSAGRVVGFADGTSGQIREQEWPGFLREQEALRTSVLKNRAAE